jgi:FkbM family methyltransferase
MGIPVVVCENTWLCEAVKKYGIAGVCCPQDDAEAFKAAIIEIATNLPAYYKKAKAARKLYTNSNTWSALVSQITVPSSRYLGNTMMNNLSNRSSLALEKHTYRRDNGAGLDETLVAYHLLLDRPSGAVMIDVGAHHGSALSAFQNRKWDVYAFEPDPKNREYLLNRFGDTPNVMIDPRAVGEEPEKGRVFYSSTESTGISGMLAFRDTHEQSATVDVTTVADIIKDRKIRHIDFLKIDVEGYDFGVLKGVPWDKMKPDVIECEFEDAKTKLLGHTWSDICDYLSKRGYTVYDS